MSASSRPATDTVTAAEPTDEGVLAAEDLIEEVSIDGMCGVY
jgi:mycofactocin precursor